MDRKLPPLETPTDAADALARPALAAALCYEWARLAPAIAAAAGGAPLTAATLEGAAALASTALELVAGAPVAPWYAGYLAALCDRDAGGLLPLASAARLGLLAPDLPPGSPHRGPLDAAAVADACAAALAHGALYAARVDGLAAPLPLPGADAAPALTALLSALEACGDDGAAAAAYLRRDDPAPQSGE